MGQELVRLDLVLAWCPVYEPVIPPVFRGSFSLKNISLMSPTMPTGYLRKRSSARCKEFMSLGPVVIWSFRLVPENSALPFSTTLTLSGFPA